MVKYVSKFDSAVYLAGAGSGTGGRSGDFFHTVFVIECADGDRLYRRVCEE